MEPAVLAAAQRRFFATGRTRSVAFRLEQLQRLETAVRSREEALLDALYADLRKSRGEAYMTELGLVYAELSAARRHLKGWARPPVGTSAPVPFPSRGVPAGPSRMARR